MSISAKMARKNAALNTLYVQFTTPHSARAGGGSESIVDRDTGKSPIWRWLTYAVAYTDAVSGPSGMVAYLQVPPGTLIEGARVGLVEAFTGTGCNAVNIGDADDTNGYIAGIDLTQNVPAADEIVWERDVDAAICAYNSDTPYRYYLHGGLISIILASADDMTTGKMLVQLLTTSYHESPGAEWA